MPTPTTASASSAHDHQLKTKDPARVARVFPNEKSLLRLIAALLAETSDDWETGKIYLNMEPVTQPAT